MSKVIVAKGGSSYYLAMGDNIDLASLIFQISKKQHLIYPCCNTKNIKSFYPDNADIQFIEIRDYNHLHEIEAQHEALILSDRAEDGITAPSDCGQYAIENFYRNAGFNWADREMYCPIREQAKKVKQIPTPKRPYAFIPEIGRTLDRGTFYINRKYVKSGLVEIIPPIDAFMLEWADMIENAEEVHCHPTAFCRLVDKLPTKGKLFMHRYLRPYPMELHEQIFIKEWKVL